MGRWRGINIVLLFLITASVYHVKFHNRGTKSGDRYDHYKGYTCAADLTRFPIGTMIAVTYNGKRIVVRVNDRIGTHKKRLDLSGRAMKDLTGSWKPVLIDVDAKVLKPDF